MDSSSSSPRDSNIELALRDPVSDGLFKFGLGDVTIAVVYKGLQVTGTVNTYAMALASSVWKKFLFPPWGNVNGPIKHIDFSEDNGEALLILLRITHLQFGAVKSKYSPETLFNIATLCEQYDCINLIKPWLQRWLYLEQWSTLLSDDHWLYISWAFGRERLFSSLAKGLVKKIQITEDGKPFTTAGVSFPEPMPDKIMESILEVRKATIKQLLDLPYHELSQYSNLRSADTTLCKLGDQACDYHMVEKLLEALKYRSLSPKVSPEDFHGSVQDLAWQVRTMYVLSYGQIVPRSTLAEHARCGVTSFETQVKRVLDTIPDPTLVCHIRHMQLRRRWEGSGC